MRIVVDTNILISALIKDSATRSILKNADLEIYYPKISFSEITKICHKLSTT